MKLWKGNENPVGDISKLRNDPRSAIPYVNSVRQVRNSQSLPHRSSFLFGVVGAQKPERVPSDVSKLQVLTALSYLNNPVVFSLLTTILRGIKSELGFAEAAYGAEHDGNLHMVERFTEWFIDFLQSQHTRVAHFMNTENTEGVKVWGPSTSDDSSLVLAVLDRGQDFVNNFDFDAAIKTVLNWQ